MVLTALTAVGRHQPTHTSPCACRGDLPEHLAEAFEGQRRAVEAMHRAATALAEPLDRSLPPLPESSLTRTTAGDVSVIVPKVATAAPLTSSAAVLVVPARCNPASCKYVGCSLHLG